MYMSMLQFVDGDVCWIKDGGNGHLIPGQFALHCIYLDISTEPTPLYLPISPPSGEPNHISLSLLLTEFASLAMFFILQLTDNVNSNNLVMIVPKKVEFESLDGRENSGHSGGRFVEITRISVTRRILFYTRTIYARWRRSHVDGMSVEPWHLSWVRRMPHHKLLWLLLLLHQMVFASSQTLQIYFLYQ